MLFLTEPQRKKLAACGLNATTISRARLHAGSSQEVRLLLGYPAGRGLVIPFDDHYCIVRLDDKNQDRRYRCPKGQGNRLYCPATLPPGILEDVSRRLYVTEGPLKALKATQDGFPCVALNGIWGWKTKDQDDPDGDSIVIQDLLDLELNGREVVVVFDSDLKPRTVENVRRAEQALTRELWWRGAVPYVVRIPPDPAGLEKYGVDDYLAKFGAAAFAALPLLVPDHDHARVDDVLDRVEQATDLAPWLRFKRDRDVLGYALKVARTRHSLVVPLYLRSVAKAIDASSSTAGLALKRLCRNGWLRRDPASTSYFHIEPSPQHGLLPKDQFRAGGSKSSGPPIHARRRVPPGGIPREGKGGVKEGCATDGTPPSKEPGNWAGMARLLELAVPSAHRPDHDVWDQRALGPSCRDTYRLLIAMGEVSARNLATLMGNPVEMVLRRLRRLRGSGLATVAGESWSPILAPVEFFDDLARKFDVLGLGAARQMARDALHRQQQVTNRKWNKGKKPMTPP